MFMGSVRFVDSEADRFEGVAPVVKKKRAVNFATRRLKSAMIHTGIAFGQLLRF